MGYDALAMTVERLSDPTVPVRQLLDDVDGALATRVLETIRTGVIVVDGQGVITHCNASAADILGRDYRGQSRIRIESVLAPIEQLIAGMSDESRGEYELERPSGETVTLGYHVADMKNGRSAVVFQNITKLVKLREERDRLLQLATVGEVMPMLLHELKNPLAAVSTAVEVLIEEMPPGEVQDDLHAILGEMLRMKLCFDGLGAVGRSLRATRLAPIDVACREAALVLRSRAEKTQVELLSDVKEMPRLLFDPAVIRAIVFNLVVNAIDACEAGGTVSLGAILIDGDSVFELCVRDTGRGMSEEEIARCTELFYTTKPKGTGIGLALCMRAVERAGGTMRFESAVGKGTTIRVRVPLEG
jgi:signal transduction histidine kinase